ncbi:MAG: ATP-binding protein [Gammaproteobacteria bacterium]|nr:ATP-binding protein [Gammaproteobacteria bacterium]
MSDLSFKQLTIVLTVLLFVLGGVVSSGIVYLSDQNQLVENSWDSFQEKFSEKTRLKSSLDSILGYGGMIHKFKNLVLRKDIKQLHEVLSQLGAANILLEKYSNLVVSEGEIASINDIRDVLVEYQHAAEKIEQAILQGLTSSQIDERVKVDDTLALRGLKLLRKENVRQHALFGDNLSKALQLGKLQTILGYGGMIHAFKNYVLRSDEKYKKQAQIALSDARAAIEQYKKSNFIMSSETLALEDVSVTIDAYSKGVEKIETLIKQGKSIELIDTEVRVDDRLALRGLRIIDREINHQIQDQADDVSAAFASINRISQTMLVVVLGLVFVVIVINAWVIGLRIARPIKEMSIAMNALSHGDVHVKLAQYAGDNEVAQMAQSIEVFRDNAVKRIDAEKKLQLANEELNEQLSKLRMMRERGDEQTVKALSLAEGLATARDEAMAATNRAEAERERIRAIIDTVSDCIITINEKGLIKTFNPTAEHIFGYKEADVNNQNVNILMSSPYEEAHDGYIKNYLKTGVGKIISSRGGAGKRTEVIGKRKDGTLFPIELSVDVSEVAGEKMFTAVVRDISRQKKIEQLKQNFVSSVSHELRTPLTAIKGSVGLIASGKLGLVLDEQSKSLMDITRRNIDRLESLINDLLDFEKLESGSIELVLAPVKVTEILVDSIAVNQHYATSTNIGFVSAGGVDALVNVDAGRIAQVMANLLSNAAKFSPAGGEVTVGASRKDDMIYFYVSDNGDGVPEEFGDKMFDRFTQADSSDKKKKGGTGLGMAISKAIIEKHQGEIGFNSELGKGTEFYFLLPELKFV